MTVNIKPGNDSAHGKVITQGQLESMGEEFGLRPSELTVQTLDGDADREMFSGVFSHRALSSGCDLMASDLLALRSERMSSTMPGRFLIRLPFQAVTIGIGKTALEPVGLEPGRALTIALQDPFTVDGAFVAGNRYTDFFVYVSSDALLDDALLERVAGKLAQNRVELFPVDASLCERALVICQAQIDDCVQGLLAESCALELLALSLSPSGGETEAVSPSDRRKMEIVRDLLIQEPHRDHRIADLARQAGVGVTTLKSKFKAVFGHSVVSFLRDTRLERAKQGISAEGWTVSQAAYIVGYRHQSSFSTAFRRKFGVWPSELRRM